MKMHVLGSGAGGGFPQWNCNCRNCRGVRDGTVRARARTQSSIAVSGDGERWFIVNASPDIRRQIESFPALHPRSGPRDTPIDGIVLTNADIDHVVGLLSLREFQPLRIFATETVRGWIVGGNAVFRTLFVVAGQCKWERLECGGRTPLIGVSGKPSGITAEVTAVAGKPPAYLGLATGPDEATIGIRLIDEGTGRSLGYVPGIRHIGAECMRMLERCDTILFDGTFWSDDELPSQGVGRATAFAMGHLPMSGREGSLSALATLANRRRIYIHINNTNPVLDEDSDARREVERAGWEIAWDGMDLEV